MMLQFRIIWKRSIAIISDNIVKFTDYHTFILWLLYLSPVVPFVSVSSRDLKTRPSAGQTTLNITCWFRIYKDQTLPHYLILCVNFLYLSCFQTMFRNIIILGKFFSNSIQKSLWYWKGPKRGEFSENPTKLPPPQIWNWTAENSADGS